VIIVVKIVTDKYRENKVPENPKTPFEAYKKVYKLF